MSRHVPAPSPEPKTYSAREPVSGQKLTCGRCGRVYPFPRPGAPPIRCECGWVYENAGGRIREEFKPRLGV